MIPLIEKEAVENKKWISSEESHLPDVAVRIMGIADLVALPILAYSTIRKIKKD